MGKLLKTIENPEGPFRLFLTELDNYNDAFNPRPGAPLHVIKRCNAWCSPVTKGAYWMIYRILSKLKDEEKLVGIKKLKTSMKVLINLEDSERAATVMKHLTT